MQALYQLSYTSEILWSQQDLNLRPLACEANALPAELCDRMTPGWRPVPFAGAVRFLRKLHVTVEFALHDGTGAGVRLEAMVRWPFDR